MAETASFLDLLLGVRVQSNGTQLTPRRWLNFDSSFTVTDDPTNDRITISGGGGGGGIPGGDLGGADVAHATVLALTGTSSVIALHGTTIKGDDVTGAGATAPTTTFQAANATGTGSTTGSTLDLKSGTGNTPGAINLKIGATAKLTISPTGSISFPGYGTQGVLSIGASGAVQIVSGIADGLLLSSNSTPAPVWSSFAKLTSTGLRVGDTTTATAKLDVQGDVKATSSISAFSGATRPLKLTQWTSDANYNAIYSVATPGDNNFLALSDGTNAWYNAPAGGKVFITVTNSTVANFGTVGLRIGDSTVATEKLDVVGNILATGFTKLGTNPASAGQVRIPNNTSVSARNAANSSNIVLAKTDGSNNIQFGDTTGAITEIQCGSGQSVRLSPSATAQIIAADTGTTVGVASSTNKHTINGGVSHTVKSVSANLTIDTTTTDYLVLVDSTAATRTITLPAATSGRRLIIKRKAGTNTISIVVPGSEKIDNQSKHIDLITDVSGASISPFVELMSDGTDWFITSAWSAQVTA